ncbi:hypothetical protein [Vitiosangium sp. GDMCC 1.1324]|uniref:hypothetical protein n=1 Tax=Vitiosangium sp. (strain GDMCC 1.1324) TaxID=2138576 RepID=UPI000D39BE41|nr:hypothetical protein [Vitiosangium sp. GDMCC 1.1324]PTL83112.1 hypothetical protein DAT35_13955 [Vitiosangium sp. GDMCC 1.1324]
MKTHRALGWILPLGCAAWLGACGGEQPAPQCAVGRGDHAVRYSLKSGTGICAQKKAEIIGAQAFRTPGSGVPPTLVLKPATLAAWEGKDPAHSVTASGDFTTEYPGEDGVCVVPSLSEARQVVSPEPGTTVDVRFLWSNLRIQDQAAIPGTQWTAELTFSEGDCTATYEAVGVFPAIKCERDVPNPEDPTKTLKVRDPRVCKEPKAGLSLDPAFPIVCEESTNLCVLDGQPPALVP